MLKLIIVLVSYVPIFETDIQIGKPFSLCICSIYKTPHIYTYNKRKSNTIMNQSVKLYVHINSCSEYAYYNIISKCIYVPTT